MSNVGSGANFPDWNRRDNRRSTRFCQLSRRSPLPTRNTGCVTCVSRVVADVTVHWRYSGCPDSICTAAATRRPAGSEYAPLTFTWYFASYAPLGTTSNALIRLFGLFASTVTEEAL